MEGLGSQGVGEENVGEWEIVPDDGKLPLFDDPQLAPENIVLQPKRDQQQQEPPQA
eukprot:CAMPEP_0201517814 /NCGR_PEP_ID=MMETSP0161_2-20130828/8829_1 /ASSEMBLY_ACC=CAM_ASM_000251 /TAXON_ID=180227 /ORGANISM="Neoparamoeba aestuarina, Strain SoJaBio B1-5/56/2" /LENGTH=55 /DNA_ID=CAMNT_0047915433 /DNA_START=44 /DNA_END=211 /DNA_ORIENTATION=+